MQGIGFSGKHDVLATHLHANVDHDAEQMHDLSIDGHSRERSRVHPAIVGIAPLLSAIRRYPNSPSGTAPRRRERLARSAPRHVSGREWQGSLYYKRSNLISRHLANKFINLA